MTRTPKYIVRTIASTATALALLLAACGPKDADLKTAADAALGGASGVSVEVSKGVATLSGQFADSAAKSTALAAIQAVKGVKSVTDNSTVAPPPVVLSPDDSLKANIATALAEYSTITTDVKDGVVTLTGEIKKTDLPRLMQALSALHPKKIDNKAKVTK